MAERTPRRYEWIELPTLLRAAIESAVGRVTAVEVPRDDYTSSFAGVLTTPRGMVFAKVACWDDNLASGVGQRDEVEAARLVERTLPTARLLDVIDIEGWSALVYTVVGGRAVSYHPGSPDLTPVALAVRALGELRPLPTTHSLPTLTDRLGCELDDADLELLRGDRLLHLDLDPANVRMVHGRAVLLDWGRAAIGPAWVDSACLYIWMRREAYARDRVRNRVKVACPGWSDVPPAAFAALVRAVAAGGLHPLDDAALWAELLAPATATSGARRPA